MSVRDLLVQISFGQLLIVKVHAGGGNLLLIYLAMVKPFGALSYLGRRNRLILLLACVKLLNYVGLSRNALFLTGGS